MNCSYIWCMHDYKGATNCGGVIANSRKTQSIKDAPILWLFSLEQIYLHLEFKKESIGIQPTITDK